MVAAVLMLGQGVASAQGAWGSVKSWTGTMTIEATDTRKQGAFSSKMIYKATGDFTISDDALPDGSHVMWPMPSTQANSERWQARVVATYEAKGVGEMGDPFSVACAADNRKASQVGVMVDPTAPKYVLSVTAPEAIYKCSGYKEGWTPNVHLPKTAFQITGPRGAPGPVSGSKVFTELTMTINVSFTMAPSRKK
jgi:hypothetical protein